MERDFNFAELRQSSEPMMSLRDRRHSVLLHATVVLDGGAHSEARVRNISRGGVMVECRFPGRAGDRIEIAIRGQDDLFGRVAWARSDMIGVMFDEPIELEAVLRRPAGSRHPETVPRPPARPWRPALHCA